jgi:hypothetical protein
MSRDCTDPEGSSPPAPSVGQPNKLLSSCAQQYYNSILQENKKTVELGYNVMNWTEYFVSLQTNVITEQNEVRD